eukprot:TRINITY_DN10479_c0_g1_i1.p1 TRINITY_DN10479_c0_g1~~TRINITY_DN10479_c0_g1_i1.p1  ORF type:complete len:323 (+),score=91.28 TRINITY_DN10479_c0_g1_i1:74-1042(+)
MKKCNYCENPDATSRCSQCNLVYYCDQNHQKMDWKVHKLNCETLQKIKENNTETPVFVESKPKQRRKNALDPSKFPSLLNQFEYIPSSDGVDENILILFHGLGDSEKPYAAFAKQFNLPQTACMAMRGPLSVPLLEEGHYHWFPTYDESFNRMSGDDPRRLKGLKDLRVQMEQMFDVLESYGWSSTCIFLLGFSQGGSVVLDSSIHSKRTLGGVVSISGFVLPGYLASKEEPEVKGRAKLTPFFVSHGTRDEVLPLESAKPKLEHLKQKLGKDVDWTFKIYEKAHTMVSSPTEAKELAEFFSKHLRLRNISLEDRADLVQIS